MAKKYFLSFLTVLVGLSLASCGFIKNYGNRKSSTSSSTTSQVSQKDSSKSDKASDKDVSTTIETKRIGSADYGYIDIPSNWIKFTDLDGGDSVQFTDGSAYNIVTMNGYTREKAHVQDGETFNAELIAQ